MTGWQSCSRNQVSNHCSTTTYIECFPADAVCQYLLCVCVVGSRPRQCASRPAIPDISDASQVTCQTSATQPNAYCQLLSSTLRPLISRTSSPGRMPAARAGLLSSTRATCSRLPGAGASCSPIAFTCPSLVFWKAVACRPGRSSLVKGSPDSQHDNLITQQWYACCKNITCCAALCRSLVEDVHSSTSCLDHR